MRIRGAAQLGRSMFDDDGGIKDDQFALALQREREVDLFGRVLVSLVVATGGGERVAPDRDRATEEVATGPSIVDPSLTAKRQLTRDGVARGAHDAERDGAGQIAREGISDGLCGIGGQEHGVVVEEHQHVGGGIRRQEVSSSRNPEILVRAKQMDTVERLERGRRSHVQHDYLVEAVGGGKRSAQLGGTIVTDHVQPDCESVVHGTCTSTPRSRMRST